MNYFENNKATEEWLYKYSKRSTITYKFVSSVAGGRFAPYGC